LNVICEAYKMGGGDLTPVIEGQVKFRDGKKVRISRKFN
jgi:hypothetical protein